MPPGTGGRLKRLPQILANLPSWLHEELRGFSARRWISRAARKFRHVRRWLISLERYRPELDDLFDINRVPTQNRELMRTDFAAYRDYLPGRYPGKLTLFRARTRSLLSDSVPDLGWSRYVDDPEICHLPGNHETILHAPNVTELARQLRDRLNHVRVNGLPSQKTREFAETRVI